MAKGDVVMKFDADTAAFVQKVVAGRQAMEAGADSARKFGKQTAEAGEEAHGAFDKMSDGAKDLAIELTGVASVTDLLMKGIEAVQEAWDKRLELMKEKTGEMQQQVTDLGEAMAGAGKLGGFGEVREGLEKMKVSAGMIVNPQERDAMAAAVFNSVPGVTSEQALAATAAGLRARAGDMSAEAATGVAVNLARLQRDRETPGRGLEGKSDTDLENIAYSLQIGGSTSPQERRLLERSKYSDESINLLRAARLSDEGPRALEAIEQLAGEDIDPARISAIEKKMKTHPSEVTDDEKRLMALSAIPQAARLQTILAQPQLAPNDKQRAVANVAAAMRNLPSLPSLRGSATIAGNGDPFMAAHGTDINVKNALAQAYEANSQMMTEQTVRDTTAKIMREEHPIADSIPFVTKIVTELAVKLTPHLEKISDHTESLDKKTDANSALKRDVEGQR